MAMEITVEALEGDLCDDKFEQEMDTVDLVTASIESLKSEDETIQTTRRRGRPKKTESPVTDDGKILQIY